MGTKRTVKAQMGGGMFIAGIILALPGALLIMQGAVERGLGLELIPAVLIIGGLRLNKSESNVKAQVGDGMFVAGIVFALLGVLSIVQGAVEGGLVVEMISAVLIIGGLGLKKSGSNEAPSS